MTTPRPAVNAGSLELGGELLAVVDDNDQQVGVVARAALAWPQTYRVSALWLTDTAGRVLLAQRAWNKRNDPGAWGPAAAGTVTAGENYVQTMVRESDEELGLAGMNLVEADKVLADNGKARFFCQWFTATVPAGTPIRMQESEVAAVAWLHPDELRRQLAETPERFLPGSAAKWSRLL